MNDPTGTDGPIKSFGRMTATPRIYGTPVTALGSIDKSVTVRPFLFFGSRSPSGGKDTLHPSRETS